MARVLGGLVVMIPGVRAALVEHRRQFGARWNGPKFLALADAVKAGQPVRPAT